MAITVVLYNPDRKYLDGLKNYVNSSELVILVDNSEKKNEWIIEELGNPINVLYRWNKANKGIAFALNRAVRIAMHYGYKWLLTMDQDSYMPEASIKLLASYIQRNDLGNIGIVAGRFHDPDVKERSTQKQVHKNVVITSGSVVNLIACQNVGGFENELFIDCVDFEYCFNLKKHGYKILQLNDAVFSHGYGERKRVKGRTTLNYGAVRYYYIARNTYHMNQEYRAYAEEFGYTIKNEYMKYIYMIVYEKRPIKKLCAMLFGYLDAKRNRYGKCKWRWILNDR